MRVFSSLGQWISRAALITLAGTSFAACASDFSTEREVAENKNTLGEEIFIALCDRLGASSFTEDLDGASYKNICHKIDGKFNGTEVDTSFLPPVANEAKTARARSVAKLEAMARHRASFIAAIDQVFPDEKIDDPRHPSDKDKQVRVYDALDLFSKKLVPLYETHPLDKNSKIGLIPEQTQAIARFFSAIADSEAAQKGWAAIGSRQGYRPSSIALGAVKPLFLYPDFRRFMQLSVDRFGSGGKLEEPFQRMLHAVEGELKALQPDEKIPALSVNDAIVETNRPRTKIELITQLMYSTAAEYSDGSGKSRYIAMRDPRGYALPVGVMPGVAGSVSLPFRDKDGDGLPDVDALGRFLGDDGDPFIVPPFKTPNFSASKGFSYDKETARALRDGDLLFQYIDSSEALLGRILRDTLPMMGPKGTDKDPLPSTLMKVVEGSYKLSGDRKATTSFYGAKSGPKKKNGAPEFYYSPFDSSTSPLVDLTHAVGQILAAPESDDYLGYMLQLHENHPTTTSRVTSLAFDIWDKGKTYPNATLSDQSTFYDDFTEWAVRVARVGPERYLPNLTGAPAGVQSPGRGLLTDVLIALNAPETKQWIPLAYGPAFLNRDDVNYNPDNLNGPPKNKTTGQLFGANPLQFPVDRNQTDAFYQNRSVFQRFVQLIAECNHVKSCNKYNAKIRISTDLPCLQGFLGDLVNFIVGDYIEMPLDIDPFNDPPPIEECGLFAIDELAVFFIDALLPDGHPRKAKLKVLDQNLLDLVNTLEDIAPGVVAACGLNINDVFTNSSLIDGLTADNPTAQALGRLVYFDAESSLFPTAPLDPYINSTNKQTNLFISGVTDPIGTNLCPKDPTNGVNKCATFDQTLRARNPGAIFYFEAPYVATGPNGKPSSGFYEGMRPMLTAFANYSIPNDGRYDQFPGACPQDVTSGVCVVNGGPPDVETGRCPCPGELIFTDLIDILHKHWPQDVSGISRYEELLAWLFSQSDLWGVVSELMPLMQNEPYVSRRVKPSQLRDGLEVSKGLTQYLLDPKVAAANNLVDRTGKTVGLRNDGSSRPSGEEHITPYDMIVAALRGMDARMADDPEAKARWKEARAELVDTFVLAKNGQWVNPAFAKMLPQLGKLTREHVNAYCKYRDIKNPATGQNEPCTWASVTLAQELADLLERPIYPTVFEFQEAIRNDDEARVEVEKLMTYLLSENTDDPDALAATLSSVFDMIQVMQDEEHLDPIMNAAAEGLKPTVRYTESGKKQSVPEAGAAALSFKLFKMALDDGDGLSDDEATDKLLDRYHIVDMALRKLVTPMGKGKLTPLEEIMDLVAEIHRIDSSNESSLDPEDYAAVMGGVEKFLIGEYRGLTQFYEIVCSREGRSANECACRVAGLVDSDGNVDSAKCTEYLNKNSSQ